MNARPDMLDTPIGIKTEKQIEKCLESLRQLESNLWAGEINDHAISNFQQAFRDYESLLAEHSSADTRAHFIIAIPVADRPEQLQNCLQSILRLCELYMYGGFHDGFYTKVSILIADDSADQKNITHNQSLCQRYIESGLKVEYFGLAEQIKIVQSIPEAHWKVLGLALGDITNELNRSNFSQKGASIMRNIAYLRLREITANHDNSLVYFIDSDQEFCVNLQDVNEEKNIYAINYFHHINEIFSNTKTEILTGKVVGDPPVSPSVMAGKFLDDVIAFTQQISQVVPESNCEFHASHLNLDDASYHDMATLFGFNATDKTHEYHCTLPDEHSNHDCMLDFSSKLNNFFHGEHPTRNTQFAYSGSLCTTIPARTVYTGNYVFKPESLKHHIAFADLHLRMAGPTLGRLLKADIGDRFASANLPMLHNRTITSTGQSEFRKHIEQTSDHVDLSGEFELQYFGDIMLFTIIELTRDGFPQETLSTEKIDCTLQATEQKIHQQYIEKHNHILNQVRHLQSLIKQPENWWRSETDSLIQKNLSIFIQNILHNFGEQSKAYIMINDSDLKQHWLKKLRDAISQHKETSETWAVIFR